MQGIVLAAGEGTRLGSLTADRPKGLVRVADEPLLTHCFRTLTALGIDELIVVVGFRKHDIMDYFGDAFGRVPIVYVSQPDQLGLAHALSFAEDHVRGPFVCMNGDNIVRGNVETIVKIQCRTHADAVLLVDRVSRSQATTTGVCITDDRGTLVSIVEKPDDPPSTLGITGIFAFRQAIFESCRQIDRSDRGEFELSDAINHLLGSGGRVELVPFFGWRVNVNTPRDVERAAQKLDDISTETDTSNERSPR